MPLAGKARLDRAARDKIKQLLRALYHHWLAHPVPERLTVPLKHSGGEPAGRSGQQPAADRRVH